MPEIFAFPPHEGLPDLIDPTKWGRPPTIDGYIEPDIGVTTNELEAGWTRCGRITYVGDSGQPTMVFQGLKDNSADYLYLSFLVRFDTSFSTLDRIILLFHPTVSSVKTNNHRRIDISPLTATTGAGIPGDAAQPGDDDGLRAGTSGYVIRTNRLQQGVNYYKYHLPTSMADTERWDPATFNDVTIRVRSWEPTSGSTGADHNWSVEIKLPITASGDWAGLTTNFGFYFNVIRVCSSSTCVSHFDGANTSQYTWPRANYGSRVGLLVDPVDPMAPVPTITEHLVNHSSDPDETHWPDWLGQGIIGAPASAGRGVRFIDGTSGIGTTTTAPLTGTLQSTVDTAVGATNTFAARIINEMGRSANQVKATFRIANWGIGGTTWPKIPTNLNKTPATPTNPTVPIPSIAALGGTAELRMQWGLDAPQHAAAAAMPFGSDRCLWVQLDSDDVLGVDFSEASIRRNLSFINLSTHDAPAAISGDWDPAPPGGKHRIVLLVSKREILSTNYSRLQSGPNDPPTRPPGGVSNAAYNREAGPPDPRDVERTLSPLEKSILDRYRSLKGQPASTWLVFNNAYRETQHTLTLDGVKTKLYEPIGGFGYVAEHLGPTADFNYDITGGAELKKMGQDAYVIEVPHKGEVIIHTRLEAVEPNGCLALIRRLFKMLFG
jgi:hypothetical protein